MTNEAMTAPATPAAMAQEDVMALEAIARSIDPSAFNPGPENIANYGEEIQAAQDVARHKAGRVWLALKALGYARHFPTPPAVQSAEPDRYDAGLLADAGGGDITWWQDYIRAELERAHDFYADQFARSATPPGAAEMREALQQIAEAHVPDQPMANDLPEAIYVREHVANLRRIAQRALSAGAAPEAGWSDRDIVRHRVSGFNDGIKAAADILRNAAAIYRRDGDDASRLGLSCSDSGGTLHHYADMAEGYADQISALTASDPYAPPAEAHR